jgi:exodeoxyribonuclease V gamma subunit
LREALIVTQPLQPFAPSLFDGNHPALFTYDAAWHAPSRARSTLREPRFVDGEMADAQASPARLDWREWKRWWRNPAQAFFSRSLGVAWSVAPEAVDDADDLALSGLEQYKVFDAMLGAYGKSDANAQREWLHASGALPAGAAGDLTFAELQEPLTALATARAALIGALPTSAGEAFELDLGELILAGTLPEHHAGLLVHTSRNEMSSWRLLQAWFDYLLLATQRDDAQLMLLEWDKDRVRRHRIGGASPPQARAWLADLAKLHAHGCRRPLPFFPKAAYAYAKRRDDTAAALKAAKEAFDGGDYQRGDKNDPAFALVVRGCDPFVSTSPQSRDFVDCALRVFAPLLDMLRQIDGDGDATKKKPRGKSKVVE